MALKQIITKACQTKAIFDGVELDAQLTTISDDFYIKVETISGSKASVNCVVSFKGAKVNLIKRYDFEPKMNDKNFITQAYEHLKTLPEFTGAIDC
jgi:maleate cis-trans isomerase